MVKVNFGVWLDTRIHYDDLKNLVIESEKLGYHSIWCGADHVLGWDAPAGPAGGWRPDFYRLEAWTTLSTLASLTTRIRLGVLVLCNAYRIPSILAKQAATLDNISNGRLEFGYGAGNQEQEYVAYGIKFPAPAVRIKMTAEALEVIKRMWTEEKPTFEGKYYRIKDAYCEPKPVQKPHPPITIGGSGEKLTLRMVAQYANRSSFQEGLDSFERKLAVLKMHCERVGRDYDEIEKSASFICFIAEDEKQLRKDLEERYSIVKPPISYEEWSRKQNVGTPENWRDKIEKYMDLGVTFFIIRFGDFPSSRGLELFWRKVVSKSG